MDDFNDEKVSLYGYTLDEIDDLAAEVFQLLVDEQVPIRLGILALCRAITMLGTEEDMDLACLMIDKLKEIVGDELYVEEDEEEDDESSEF